MNQQLESDLRQAFSLKAAGIPAEAGERLSGIAYHPRSRRPLPKITVASLAGVAATTGVVASVVVLGSSQPAFAGWTSVPTPASADQTAAADSACLAQLSSAPPLPGTPAGGWSQEATDVRGPFTLAVYQSGDTDATCLTGPSITIVSRSSATGASTSASSSGSGPGPATSGGQGASSITVGGTGSGSITHVTVAHLDSASQGSFTVVEGQVEAGVSAVTLLRSDGDHVRTTTGNGWFVAWWPGDLGAGAAEITTSGGVTTQTLNTAPPGPPAGSGTCNRSTQATSSATVCSGGGAGGGTPSGQGAVTPDTNAG